MAARPLTVHNAEIHTATVEIKTLTVGGRQVTQAVFRQLQEAYLVQQNGHLAGVPWGRVNYHPDLACKKAPDHIHVVWQRGTELLRSVEKWVEPDDRWYQSEYATPFAQALHCRSGHTGGGCIKPLHADSRRLTALDRRGDRFEVSILGVVDHDWHAREARYSTVHAERAHCRIQEPAHLWESLLNDVERQATRRAARYASWEALLALPQLFIAV